MQHTSEIEKIRSCYANNLRDPVSRQLTPKPKKIFLVNFVAIRSRKSSSRVPKKKLRFIPIFFGWSRFDWYSGQGLTWQMLFRHKLLLMLLLLSLTLLMLSLILLLLLMMLRCALTSSFVGLIIEAKRTEKYNSLNIKLPTLVVQVLSFNCQQLNVVKSCGILILNNFVKIWDIIFCSNQIISPEVLLFLRNIAPFRPTKHRSD